MVKSLHPYNLRSSNKSLLPLDHNIGRNRRIPPPAPKLTTPTHSPFSLRSPMTSTSSSVSSSPMHLTSPQSTNTPSPSTLSYYEIMFPSLSPVTPPSPSSNYVPSSPKISMNYKNALVSFSTHFDYCDIELYNILWIRYNTKMTTTISIPSTSTTKPFPIKDAAQPNRTGSSNSLFSGENSDEHHPFTSSSTPASIICTAITSAADPSTSISIKDNAQLNRSGSSISHLSDENSKEHHPIPPASIKSATITTTPINNPTKLSYSAKKRLARKKKKQAQLSSSTISNTALHTPSNTSIPKLSNTTPTNISTTPTPVTLNTRQPLNTTQARRSPPHLRNFNVDFYTPNIFHILGLTTQGPQLGLS